MKFASQRISPHKLQQQPNIYQTIQMRNLVNARIKNQRCYMHYNNAVYMGGMISYKRNGQGILLLDDGTSILTDYCYDKMVGHNVIYSKNAIISVLFIKGSLYEMVSRTEHYIFQIIYDDQEQTITGNGLLIDFKNKKIYHLIYNRGKVMKKIVESNRDIIEQIFSNRLTKLINAKHENALKFRLKFENGVSIRIEQKKIIIGYGDSYEQSEGLGFILRINEEKMANFSSSVDMKCLQRGYYHRNKLTNFGERYFQNGNLYIGEFQNGCFHGKGLLVYPNQSKWVYGYFQSERLKKMLNMSIDQKDRNSRGELHRCMKQIHEFNTKNYMSVNVSIISWEYLSSKLEQANFAQITAKVVEKQRNITEEQERLFMIEEHFVNETPNNQIDRVMVKQMEKNANASEKVLLNQFSSMKPKMLQIESRYGNSQGNGPKNAQIYFSRQTLTPKHQKLKRDHRDTYDAYGCLTPNSRSGKKEQTSAKMSKSPLKKYGYECNTFYKY